MTSPPGLSNALKTKGLRPMPPVQWALPGIIECPENKGIKTFPPTVPRVGEGLSNALKTKGLRPGIAGLIDQYGDYRMP